MVLGGLVGGVVFKEGAKLLGGGGGSKPDPSIYTPDYSYRFATLQLNNHSRHAMLREATYVFKSVKEIKKFVNMLQKVTLETVGKETVPPIRSRGQGSLPTRAVWGEWETSKKKKKDGFQLRYREKDDLSRVDSRGMIMAIPNCPNSFGCDVMANSGVVPRPPSSFTSPSSGSLKANPKPRRAAKLIAVGKKGKSVSDYPIPDPVDREPTYGLWGVQRIDNDWYWESVKKHFSHVWNTDWMKN